MSLESKIAELEDRIMACSPIPWSARVVVGARSELPALATQRYNELRKRYGGDVVQYSLIVLVTDRWDEPMEEDR